MLCYALEYLPQNGSALNCIGKMVLPIVIVFKLSLIIFYIHKRYANANFKEKDRQRACASSEKNFLMQLPSSSSR